MSLSNSFATVFLICTAVWSREVDTSMTHVAKLPGPARMLVEATDGRIFVVLDKPRAGLALVVEDGVRMVYEGTVASAAVSLDGLLYLVSGEDDRGVIRLSAEEGKAAADGREVMEIEVVTAAFGGAPTGNGNVVRATDGTIRVEGCPNLRRADGTFEPVSGQGGGDFLAAQVAAHNGEIWVMGGVRTKRTFRYDPEQGEWLPGPDLPTEQSWGSASDLNGRLVLAGGARWSEFHQRYIFDDSAYMYKEGSFEELE